MEIEDLATPALLLNVDALERNLHRMADDCRAAGVALRPHTKTHKSPWIARRQVELGAAGVCAAKVGEAEVLVQAGIGDVLITTDLVPTNMDRALDLAGMAHITVVVDSVAMARELGRRSNARGLELNVLVDLNVGQNRTGVDPGPPALEVATAVAEARGLRLAGLQAYEGHCQLVFDPWEQRRRAFESYERLLATRQRLEEAGLRLPWVTTAGTGTYRLAIEHGVATEVQPGSYVVMDTQYARVEPPRFEQALFVLASVVSTNRADCAVVDAGWKSLSSDGGPPTVRGRAEPTYEFAGDEHGRVSGLGAVGEGDRVWLVPSHCDTTINLHDRYVLVRDDGRVQGTLPVAARGRSA
ncbi:MAG TPA: DSD1 family PLP-dependent enzyme [Candidatus Dormibacteraeota bacterium]|nr:DSD1 family PLP-dependent enzyme [Candidatus Dormibacteraeota bacterium]